MITRLRVSALPAGGVALATVLAAGPVLAHTGSTPVSGLIAGLSHPVFGLDHLLAMVAVGLLAVQAGGRALWALPAAFVGAMIVGGALGMAALPMPLVEPGIVGSVIVLGAVIAWGRTLTLALSASLVALFALTHGHAHGTEMPVGAGGFIYAAGFAVATAALHGLGIALGLGVGRLAAALKARDSLAPLALRISGATIGAAGLGLAVAG